jgi:hypothetical protein
LDFPLPPGSEDSGHRFLTPRQPLRGFPLWPCWHAQRLLKIGDQLPGGKRHTPDADLPQGSDATDWATKLGIAKLITELNDEIDTPVKVLLSTLNTTIAAKSKAVTGHKAVPTTPGH